MTNGTRKLVGKSATFGIRQRVYQTADGFDVEMREQYEVMQRRVLFDDVQLVTIHHRLGPLYLILTGSIASLFAFIAILIVSVDANDWEAALVPAFIGLPFLILFLARLAFGQEVITIFGRRSKAEMRFAIRKRLARETYGKICAAVREAQRGTSVPPVAEPFPEGILLPPDL
ncbi:MAG TPA: hypothetical protein VEK57_02100 [Thermoanaerobaculia bacterium]|nr:hypothetical protein [Thermoanaerobaculia bacterium]